MKVAHLTTIDLTLRYLLFPQLLAVLDKGGESLAISAPGRWVSELESAGIQHIPLRASTRTMSPRSDLRAAQELWRILRRERPDILHTHNPKPGFYGRVLGRLAGVPIVINTVHGLYASPEDPLAKRAFVYGLETIASRFSDAELVQSREDLDLMIKWHLAPRRRMRLLGNGIDLARFDPDRFDSSLRARVRTELGVGSEEVLVGMVGRLVVEKGFLDLFTAARSLDSHYRVLVVGPDDPEKDDAIDEKTITHAKRLGILVTGMRTDVDELYSAMDIFVLPSYREGFPRAAMEASAMGLPVVATDIRGCREVVEHEVTGLLIPVGDPAALAAAIRRLGDDPELRTRLGEQAHEKALRSFDERDIVETVMETYRDVARAKGLALFDDQTLVAGDGRSEPGVRYRIAKRLFDIAGATLGLLVLLPIMAVIAVLIRLTIGRPVLFTQMRPGRHARPFRLYKFRTMLPLDQDEQEGDSDTRRITTLGAFLRRFSLDELPQLVNVLKGDMSLVGPRPLLMRYLELYSREQARRHEAKPGLTGWAQIHGRNARSWEERLAMDVWYVDHGSMKLDLEILRETVSKVLSGEGVSQGDRATVDYFEGTSNGSPDE